MLVKQDQMVEFGLKIKQRKHQKMTLFEFNIEKQINFQTFLEYTDLDINNSYSINEFLSENYLMKLKVFDQSMDLDEKR